MEYNSPKSHDVTKSKQPLRPYERILKPINAFLLALIPFVIINLIVLFSLFIPDVIFYFFGIFIFVFGGIILLFPLLFIINKNAKNRLKAFIIWILTPIVAFLIMVSQLPIHLNFYWFQSQREEIAQTAISSIDEHSNLHYQGVEVSFNEDNSKVVYFIMTDSTPILVDYPPYIVDVYYGHSGFIYQENAFGGITYKDADSYLPINKNWGYVSYRTKYELQNGDIVDAIPEE